MEESCPAGELGCLVLWPREPAEQISEREELSTVSLLSSRTWQWESPEPSCSASVVLCSA